MGDERVIDASVIGAALFNEAESDLARRFLAEGPTLIAPDLLFAEIASLSAKKVWRGEASKEAGEKALAVLPDFVGAVCALKSLASAAFKLAADHRFSAYDGFYLALAQQRETVLVTLDARLMRRAGEVGLGTLVARPG